MRKLCALKGAHSPHPRVRRGGLHADSCTRDLFVSFSLCPNVFLHLLFLSTQVIAQASGPSNSCRTRHILANKPHLPVDSVQAAGCQRQISDGLHYHLVVSRAVANKHTEFRLDLTKPNRCLSGRTSHDSKNNKNRLGTRRGGNSFSLRWQRINWRRAKSSTKFRTARSTILCTTQQVQNRLD